MKQAFVLLFLSMTVFSANGQTTDQTAVSSVLDNLHLFASQAEFESYFDLYTRDAVFLGTDATERWSMDEFMGYARPSFDQGRGWTYVSTERHVYISPDGNSAWFDERLQNEAFGECRGTGALIKVDGSWKITQYNLTVPIPNDMLRRVAFEIRELNDEN